MQMNLDSVYVTIDTEPDCDRRWRRSSPLTFTSVTEGIPRLLRPIWDRLNVRPIYFVSPEVLTDSAACRALRDEVENGATIGTHLHSEYVLPDVTIADAAGKASMEFPCYAHSTEVEREKIRRFTDLIVKRLGVRPSWYRAARFGADLDTIRCLRELGYTYDSSVTPGIDWSRQGGPDHRRAPAQPYWVSRDDFYAPAEERKSLGIIEVPITVAGKRFGRLGKILPDSWLAYRWLRPTHMTLVEQCGLIDDMRREFANPTLVFMFHSMEVMIDKSPYVRNRFMQWRFLDNLERSLAYALHSDVEDLADTYVGPGRAG